MIKRSNDWTIVQALNAGRTEHYEFDLDCELRIRKGDVYICITNEGVSVDLYDTDEAGDENIIEGKQIFFDDILNW